MQSFAILDELLSSNLAPGAVKNLNGPPREIGVGRVESPRGETVCTVQSNGKHDQAFSPAHRLTCELARGRARLAGKSAPGLSAHQQEL